MGPVSYEGTLVFPTEGLDDILKHPKQVERWTSGFRPGWAGVPDNFSTGAGGSPETGRHATQDDETLSRPLSTTRAS
jgi:hypothetical protein